MDVPDLDPVIHQASRLRIMTVLFQARTLAVARLREHLGMTDGNLASHLQRLEEAGHVKSGRVLAGLAFELRVKITDEGSAAFRAYLAALRRYVEALHFSDDEEIPPESRPAPPSPKSSASARS